MLLTRYGIREWLTVTVAAGIAIGVLVWLGRWQAAVVPGAVALATVCFFRDPPRRVPQDLPPGVMLSPADGKVTAVEHVDHHAAVGGPAVVIRVFLSVLNVHVNRSPSDGLVADVTYTPGKFFDARSARSAQENESNLIAITPPGGETFAVRQISGKVARRIVCALYPGDRLQRGQRFGMIKFGSGTELILPHPDDVEVHVRVGDRVKAGLTSLATMSLTCSRLEEEPIATTAR